MFHVSNMDDEAGCQMSYLVNIIESMTRDDMNGRN